MIIILEVYKKSGKWYRIPATGMNFVKELGPRVPTFSVTIGDRDFSLLPFHGGSLRSDLLSRGRPVRLYIDGTLITIGTIERVTYNLPLQTIVVECVGPLSRLNNDFFGGEEWSYPSGTFSQTITPSTRIIDLPGATAVFQVKLNGVPFVDYEFDFVRSRIVLPEGHSYEGTISGKYLTRVSPHTFIASLLDGEEYAGVPIIWGSATVELDPPTLTETAILSTCAVGFGFAPFGLAPFGTDGGGIMTRWGYATQVYDLGLFSTGFGSLTVSGSGFTDIYIRAGDSRKECLRAGWHPMTSGENLMGIFGRFMRFIQLFFIPSSLTLPEIISLTLELNGNAPPVEAVVFRDISRLEALRRILECYRATFFADSSGRIVILHREVNDDYTAFLPYAQFTGMQITSVGSPKRVIVRGIRREFRPYGQNYGMREEVSGALEFTGDLQDEETVTSCAWNNLVLQNVALCYHPRLTELVVETDADFEVGDQVRVQVAKVEESGDFSHLRYAEYPGTVKYCHLQHSQYRYVSGRVIFEAHVVYRVEEKSRSGELWRYKMVELSRLGYSFIPLGGTWKEYPYSSDFPVFSDEPIDVGWEDPDTGEIIPVGDWTYDPDTGEINTPEPPPDEDHIPVVQHKPEPPVYTPPDISSLLDHWDWHLYDFRSFLFEPEYVTTMDIRDVLFFGIYTMYKKVPNYPLKITPGPLTVRPDGKNPRFDLCAVKCLEGHWGFGPARTKYCWDYEHSSSYLNEKLDQGESRYGTTIILEAEFNVSGNDTVIFYDGDYIDAEGFSVPVSIWVIPYPLPSGTYTRDVLAHYFAIPVGSGKIGNFYHIVIGSKTYHLCTFKGRVNKSLLWQLFRAGYLMSMAIVPRWSNPKLELCTLNFGVGLRFAFPERPSFFIGREVAYLKPDSGNVSLTYYTLPDPLMYGIFHLTFPWRGCEFQFEWSRPGLVGNASFWEYPGFELWVDLALQFGNRYIYLEFTSMIGCLEVEPEDYSPTAYIGWEGPNGYSVYHAGNADHTVKGKFYLRMVSKCPYWEPYLGSGAIFNDTYRRIDGYIPIVLVERYKPVGKSMCRYKDVNFQERIEVTVTWGDRTLTFNGDPRGWAMNISNWRTTSLGGEIWFFAYHGNKEPWKIQRVMGKYSLWWLNE